MQAVAIVYSIVGGLGLLLFGQKFMTDSLQALLGHRMHHYIERTTGTPLKGFLTGTLTAAVIQSSSVTTVLTVGLVNAQLITLRQAIGVILGANVGSTITALLIGFNLQVIALPLLAVGAFAFLYIRGDSNQRLISQAIIGFGALLLGLTLLGQGIEPVRDAASLLAGHGVTKGIAAGALAAIFLKSSSAAIAILQEMGYRGAITFAQAVPVILGSNLGTTLTALVSALGANAMAKRAAAAHFLFNLIGVIIFVPLYTSGTLTMILKALVSGWETTGLRMQIAETHLLFNLATALILLPLAGIVARAVTRLVPKTSERTHEFGPQYIDKRLLTNPPVAMAQATKETVRMADLAREAVKEAIDYFNDHNEAHLRRYLELEDNINLLERVLTDYVALAAEKTLTLDDSTQANFLLKTVNHVENISDQCKGIIEQGNDAARNNVSFSGEAKKELSNMIDLTLGNLSMVIKALSTDDVELARSVIRNSITLEQLREEARQGHIRRLNEHVCNGNNGAVFLDTLGQLQSIGDHCREIAKAVQEKNERQA